MARYIDADALMEELKSLQMTITGIRCGKTYLREIVREYQKSVLKIVHYQPTADVVPKSEVDRLNAVMKDMDEQRAYTINMLGENLENAKAEVQRLQAENEKLTIKMNAYGLTAKRLKEDVDRLQEINNRQVENVRLAKQEVSVEIFEEMIELLSMRMGIKEVISELKKKHTVEN